MSKQKILISLLCALTLTACGIQVDSPETGGSESDIAVTGSGDNIIERTCTIDEYDQCVQQFELVSQDLTNLASKTQQCEETLLAYRQKELDSKNDDPRLNAILKTYTDVAEQKEYPFDSCGKIGGFESKAWFSDFQTALETKAIPFVKAGRNLQTGDFTGGCSSSEGNIAFFLGAESDGNLGVSDTEEGDIVDVAEIFEFHLVKFNTETKVLEDVLMAKGLCEDDYCPALFNSREGAYIPMVGISSNQECSYKYFFDQNILIKDVCNSK